MASLDKRLADLKRLQQLRSEVGAQPQARPKGDLKQFPTPTAEQESIETRLPFGLSGLSETLDLVGELGTAQIEKFTGPISRTEVTIPGSEGASVIEKLASGPVTLLSQVPKRTAVKEIIIQSAFFAPGAVRPILKGIKNLSKPRVVQAPLPEPQGTGAVRGSPARTSVLERESATFTPEPSIKPINRGERLEQLARKHPNASTEELAELGVVEIKAEAKGIELTPKSKPAEGLTTLSEGLGSKPVSALKDELAATNLRIERVTARSKEDLQGLKQQARRAGIDKGQQRLKLEGGSQAPARVIAQEGPVADTAATKAALDPKTPAPGQMDLIDSIILAQPGGAPFRSTAAILSAEARLNSGPYRLLYRAVDNLDDMGQGGRTASAVLYGVRDAMEQGLTKNIREAITIGEKHFGRAPVKTRVNPWALNGGRQLTGMSQKELESLTNYIYSEGRSGVLPGVDLAKIKAAAEELWIPATGRASQAAQGFTVKNPVTGKNSPVGRAGMFFAHIPVKAKKKLQLKESTIRHLYNRTDRTMTFKKYKEMIDKYSDNNRLAKHQDVLPARTFDIEAAALKEGVSIYTMLGRVGYEQDFFRMSLAVNRSLLYKSGMAKNQVVLQDAVKAIEAELGEDAAFIAERIIGKASGRSSVADVVRETSLGTNMERYGLAARQLADITLLQGSAIPSTTQLVIPFALGGVRNSLKAALKEIVPGIRDQRLNKLLNEAGGDYITLANKLANPGTILGRTAMGNLRATVFTAVDQQSRTFGMLVGHEYALSLGRRLLKNPTSRSLQAQLREIRLNPDTVLQEMSKGGLSDATLERGMQVFANQTAGRGGLEGLPEAFAERNPLVMVLVQYKKQITGNLATVARGIKTGEDFKRKFGIAARAVLGSQLAGIVTKEATRNLTGRETGFEGTSPILQDIFGEDTAYYVENLFLGLSTVWGAMLLSVAMGVERGNVEGALQDAATPASASAIANIVQGLIDSGINGAPSRKLKRATPLIGTFIEGQRAGKSRGFGALQIPQEF